MGGGRAGAGAARRPPPLYHSAMATSVLPAAAARAEREIVDHLRRAGATAPAAAVPLPELHRPLSRRRLQQLLDAGVVVPADGGYWLDEALWGSYRSDRRVAVGAFAFAAATLAAGILLGRCYQAAG